MFCVHLGENGNNGHSNVSKEPDTLTHCRIGGHLLTQNRGVRMDRGRKTRTSGSRNELTKNRLALKPRTDIDKASRKKS